MRTFLAGGVVCLCLAAACAEAPKTYTEEVAAFRAEKDEALRAAADVLSHRTSEILAANADDVARAETAGTSATVIDRLRLDDSRVSAMAAGLRDVASLPDPVVSQKMTLWVAVVPPVEVKVTAVVSAPESARRPVEVTGRPTSVRTLTS